MKRRALLISNPGEKSDENYCKGVYVDVRNFRRHLESAVGGLWLADEIVTLDRPSVDDVVSWLTISSYVDYSFIVFTGHGYYDTYLRQQVVLLRSGVRMSEKQLESGSRRSTVIFDCCQERSVIIEEGVERSHSFSARARGPDSAACRRYFDKLIEGCPPSCEKLYSCSPGELSQDNDFSGGRYCASVFEVLSDWEKSQSSARIMGQAALTIPEAHERAAIKTRQVSNGAQNPVIEKPRSGPYFPIAVFA